jgi:hypothetical protein
MSEKTPISLTDSAKQAYISWLKVNIKGYINLDACLEEVTLSEHFGDPEFSLEWGAQSTNTKTPLTYRFTSQDYLYE